MLTALGVIIGIVAVTLMGTAISGIQIGFDKSMSIFGDDVLYVGQWPWRQVNDWWNYRDRKKIKTEYADTLNRMIEMTPNSNLVIAIPTSSVTRAVKYMDSEVNNVFVPRDRVGLRHHLDIRFQGGPLFQRVGIARRRECLRDRLRCG